MRCPPSGVRRALHPAVCSERDGTLRLPSHRFGGGGNGAAYQKAVREQKLAAELRNAKRERDSYLARVDKAHAIDAMVRPA